MNTHPVWVREHEVEVGVHPKNEMLHRRGRGGSSRLGSFEDRRKATTQNRGKQGALAANNVVDGADGQPGNRCHRLHAGIVKAVLGKHSLSRVEYDLSVGFVA